MKLINTPYTFTEDQIKSIRSQRNLEEKWNKCFELAFQSICHEHNKGEVANKKQRFRRILDEYINAPNIRFRFDYQKDDA